MPVDILLEIFQYWEAIFAISALFVSILTVFKDKRSRQMEMLHDVFQNISGLNIEIANYNSNDRDAEQTNQDIKIIKQEKLKEFDYLCFLVNRKKVREKEVYELGNEDIREIYERDGDDMDDDRYSDIEKVLGRWETYPPTTVGNRVILWYKKTMPSLGSRSSDGGNDEEESESNVDEESSEGEVEKNEA